MIHALPILIENLSHPDKNVRGPAVVALGNHGGSSALVALLRIVGKDPDLYVREDITWALVRQGEGAMFPLIDMLRDPDPAVRHQAAHTLGKIGDPRAAAALTAALDDSEPAVVSKAAFTLSQLGVPSAIPALVRILGHPDHEVQSTAVAALEQFGTAPVAPLIEALAGANSQVRELASDVLGALKAVEAVPTLAALLTDTHWHVRFSAVTALGHIGGGAAKAALLAQSGDPDKRVASLIARVLKRIKA